MKNSAKLLLEFASILGLSTLFLTYIISTTGGRVAPFIPIISEMPFNEPEATIFALGLGISLFSFLLVVQVLHRIFEKEAKKISKKYENYADINRIISSVGLICGIITVNFHWNNYPIIHGITAFILFTFTIISMTVSFKIMEKAGKTNVTRKYALYSAWFFFLSMVVVSFLDGQELENEGKDRFYRNNNPPDVDTERNVYLNLAAFCEWSMVFSLFASIMTYRKDLEGMKI